MKTNVIFFAFFLFVVNVSIGQSDKLVKVLDDDMQFAVDMIQSSDGNYIIAGNSYSFPHKIFVVSLNNEGEEQWRKYFWGDMLWHAGLTEKENGNILIPISRGFASLLELNIYGDSIDCISDTESASSYFGKALELGNGNIVVSEIVIDNNWPQSGPDTCFITLINPQGTIINKHFTQYFELLDIESSGDGNIFLLSLFYSSGTSIIKSTPLGTELSVSTCNIHKSYLYDIVKTDDHRYSALGFCSAKGMEAAIGVFDSDGLVEHCTTYNSSFFVSTVKDTLTQSLYVLGNEFDTCYIYTIDNTGTLISKYLVDYSLDGECLIMDENYFYITGIYNYTTDPRSCFIRMDKDSVLSVGNIQKNENMQIVLFPNPATDELYIQIPDVSYQTPESGNKHPASGIILYIFDIYGREITTKEITSKNCKLDVSAFAPGVYCAVIKDDKGIIGRKKFVVY